MLFWGMSFRGTFRTVLGKDVQKKTIQQLGYKNIYTLKTTGKGCEDGTVTSIDAWEWEGPKKQPDIQLDQKLH